MKCIHLNESVVIETPWLRGTAEAAAYCGVGRTVFEAASGALPSRGHGRVRLYHTATLDAWLAGELPDVPGPGNARSGAGERPPGRRRAVSRGVPPVLVNPKNGRTYDG